jgi:hypothetical protein
LAICSQEIGQNHRKLFSYYWPQKKPNISDISSPWFLWRFLSIWLVLNNNERSKSWKQECVPLRLQRFMVSLQSNANFSKRQPLVGGRVLC